MPIISFQKKLKLVGVTITTLATLMGASSAWASTTFRAQATNFYGRYANIFAQYDSGYYFTTSGDTVIPGAPGKSHTMSTTYFTFRDNIETRDRWVDIWYEYPKTSQYAKAACLVKVNPKTKKVVTTEYSLKCSASLKFTGTSYYVTVVLGK